MFDHPEIDDQDVKPEPAEPICDSCSDLGCPKCDPEWALVHHTAAALDRLFLESARFGIEK